MKTRKIKDEKSKRKSHAMPSIASHHSKHLKIRPRIGWKYSPHFQFSVLLYAISFCAINFNSLLRTYFLSCYLLLYVWIEWGSAFVLAAVYLYRWDAGRLLLCVYRSNTTEQCSEYLDFIINNTKLWDWWL